MNPTEPTEPKPDITSSAKRVVEGIWSDMLQHPLGIDGYVEQIRDKPDYKSAVDAFFKVREAFVESLAPEKLDAFVRGIYIGIEMAKRILADEEFAYLANAIAILLDRAKRNTPHGSNLANVLLSESANGPANQDTYEAELPLIVDEISTDEIQSSYVRYGIGFILSAVTIAQTDTKRDSATVINIFRKRT